MEDVAFRFSALEIGKPLLWRLVENTGGRIGKPASKGIEKKIGSSREKSERKADTTFLTVDAQSVKNTDAAKRKGCDGGKKVSGIKRRLAVDTSSRS